MDSRLKRQEETINKLRGALVKIKYMAERAMMNGNMISGGYLYQTIERVLKEMG